MRRNVRMHIRFVRLDLRVRVRLHTSPNTSTHGRTNAGTDTSADDYHYYHSDDDHTNDYWWTNVMRWFVSNRW